MKQKNRSLIITLFIVFLDLLGIGIVIPILAPLILDVHNSGILPLSYNLKYRTIILGLLLGMYPLAQFFGAPILGAISDHIGRKKVLIIALLGIFIGYVLSAIGIYSSEISLIFLGRIIAGFAGGSVSVAYSAIADISDESSKTRNFGLISMMVGLGFILGPYIGGRLSDPNLVNWFSYSTPFWFAALLALLNIGVVAKYFSETSTTRITSKISLLTGFKNIKRAFEIENLRVIFLVVFLLSFGFSFFTQFFQVFLIEKFNFTQANIGNIFAYIGIWIALAQGFIVRPISKIWGPAQVLAYSTILLGLTFPLLLLPEKSSAIYFILPLIAIFNGLTMPNYNALISNLTDKDSQGEIFGINQSIFALAQAIPPILAGFIATIHLDLPILLAGFSSILAWIIFIVYFEKKSETKFHEV